MAETFYALLGALAVLVAFLSARLRELPVSAPLLALVLGVLAGPHVGAVLTLDPAHQDTVLLVATRLLLAVSLVSAALRFPLPAVRRDLRAIGLLLLLVLPAAVMIGALLGAAVLGLALPAAVVLGAALSPTDPVLASGVVSGQPAEQDLPAGLRRVLTVESGANDGLALPAVELGLVLLAGGSLGHWAAEAAYTVGVAVVIGAALGLLAAAAVRRQASRDAIERSALLVFTVALAVFVLGVCKVAGTDGILGVFVAGLAFGWRVGDAAAVDLQRTIAEGLNRYLVLPVFTLLGIALPWAAWLADPWRLLGFAVAVLLLRRLPLVLALRRPLRLPRRDAVFVGWFGPIGVSALFYLVDAGERAAVPATLWAAGTLVITLSVIAHGATTVVGRRLYARKSNPFGVRRKDNGR